MELVDIGVNLTNRAFQKDVDAVVERSKSAGVSTLVLTGTSVKSSFDSAKLAQTLRSNHVGMGVFSTFGIHPHDAKFYKPNVTDQKIRTAVTTAYRNVVVAIGECGLDFNRNFSTPAQQEQAFRAQVAIACDLQLPLFLHEREAHQRLLEVLQPFAGRLPAVVIHCFTGTKEELVKYIELGFYIGLTGFVAMEKRGSSLRQYINLIPNDRLMVETDAPFMYPYANSQNNNGNLSGSKKKYTRCEPKDLHAVIETIAECKRISKEKVAQLTTENAKRFFAIKHLKVDRKIVSCSDNKDEKKISFRELDGSLMEGGGQILRTSFALACLEKINLKIHSIRAKRSKPGLKRQHLCSIELISDICTGELKGAIEGSSSVNFLPGTRMSKSYKAPFHFEQDAITAGSVSLMLQGALPCLFYTLPLPSEENFTCHVLQLKGGTNVSFSPSIEYLRVCVKRLVQSFGLDFNIKLIKRGYFPRGGGEIIVEVHPLKQGHTLKPIRMDERSNVISQVYAKGILRGSAVTAANRTFFETTLSSKLNAYFGKSCPKEIELFLESAVFNSKKKGKKEKVEVHLTVCVETSTGGLLSFDVITSDINDAIEKSCLNISRNLKLGACIDEHLADQAILYMALASGKSVIHVPGKKFLTSLHLETVIYVTSHLTNAKFFCQPKDDILIIECEGIGKSC